MLIDLILLPIFFKSKIGREKNKLKTQKKQKKMFFKKKT